MTDREIEREEKREKEDRTRAEFTNIEGEEERRKVSRWAAE